MGRLSRLLVLLAATASTGCAHVLEEGLHALVDEDGPSGAGGRYGAVPPEATRPPPFQEERPASTVSTLQHAPTLDWTLGLGPLPHAPARSIFEGMAARRMPCQAVPVGLARAFTGPTGPAASPVTRWGPFEVGVAGPDGAFDMLTAWDNHSLSVRAMSSGARLASAGRSCATRIYFYVRIGRTDDAVSVLR